jgi:hypothetical protein
LKNKNEKLLDQDTSIRQRGEAFLKKLRALPPDHSQLGKSFVTLPKKQFKETLSSETDIKKNLIRIKVTL